MKKIILLFLLLPSFFAFSQPKLVGALRFNGAKQGGALYQMNMPGTTPGITHVFDNFAPHFARGGVVAGDANWLYGTLQFNGSSNTACLYRIQQDGTGFTKLMDYNNLFFNSSRPYYHTDGKIYVSIGSELRMYDPSNGTSASITINGTSNNRSIYVDGNNFIYYTKFGNILSRIATDGTQELDLHNFNETTEGSNGVIAVTETPGDTLFGFQLDGGTNSVGTLYSIKKDGSGFFVHHQFATATGSFPESRLVYFDGKLYGTTTQGGTFGNGVIFAIDADGSNYRVLYNFEVGIGGGMPQHDIAISSNGRIFGTYFSLIYDGGFPYRMYKIDTSGTNISRFFWVNQHESGQLNQDVLLLNDQTVFLTTQEMGRHDGGTLSMIDTGMTGLTFGTPLFHFGASSLGFGPMGGLIKTSNNKLYGTTRIGGATGNGILFSTNVDGSGYTKVYEFTDADGYDPIGNLLEASDGKLYGCLQIGGPTNTGGIFRIDKNGANFQVVFRFPDLSQGYWPVGSLVEDAGGKLYGLTNVGGASSNGVVFSINRDGTAYTVLKDFGLSDFRFFVDGLVLSNGYLYGSAPSGGATSQGGYFRIKTDGTDYSVLKDYTTAPGDAQEPRGAPMIASNGKLYGTTARGGTAGGGGVIFSMDITGTNYTVLKNLNHTVDGSYAQARLIQGSDGLIYGTTSLSQITLGNNGGTLFKMNLDGSGFTVLKEFNTETEGGFATSIIDLNGPFNLPVQWLTFTAQPKEQVVQLFWQTAQEQNTDRFSVERSVDGITYQPIGSVKAAGNASSTSPYRFTDNDPQYGNNYYRLKQIDLDGKFTYSKIVRVNFEGSPVLTLHPNPTTDNLYIKAGATETIRSVIVTDINGRVVMRTGKSNRSSLTLYVKSLVSGVYWLQVETNQKKYTLKFVKN